MLIILEQSFQNLQEFIDLMSEKQLRIIKKNRTSQRQLKKPATQTSHNKLFFLPFYLSLFPLLVCFFFHLPLYLHVSYNSVPKLTLLFCLFYFACVTCIVFWGLAHWADSCLPSINSDSETVYTCSVTLSLKCWTIL